MSNLIVSTVILLCINVALYLGGFTLVDGDIMQQIFEVSQGKPTGISGDLNESIPRTTQISGIDSTSSDFRIVDALKTLFSLFLFLLNILLAPLAIFTDPGLNLPVELQFLIGVPITLIYLFVIINWWRGND